MHAKVYVTHDLEGVEKYLLRCWKVETLVEHSKTLEHMHRQVVTLYINRHLLLSPFLRDLSGRLVLSIAFCPW